MNQSKLNPQYALKDNRIVHISEVERGLQCGCKCPVCNGLLVARKGERVVHHFAHYSQTNCEYSGESSLHYAAKALLSEAKRMFVPTVYLEFPGTGRKDELIYESMEIEIDHVEVEQHFGNIIPDVVVHSNGRKFFVEIYVTHRIDEKKLNKLKEAHISTLEIDLSQCDYEIDPSKLAHFLLDDCKEKTWIYNAKAERYFKMLLDIAERKPIIQRGFALHVDGCPCHSRIWHGRVYANYNDDCYFCEYHIATDVIEDLTDDGLELEYYIFCSGANRIRGICDIRQNQL